MHGHIDDDDVLMLAQAGAQPVGSLVVEEIRKRVLWDERRYNNRGLTLFPLSFRLCA